MSTPSSSMRDWARRLLDAEAAAPAGAELRQLPAVSISERMRAYLTRLIGPDGFLALQRRALALARAEVPSLQSASLTANGGLEGIEELGDGGEAATAITAHMLELLIALIGKSLTFRLMLDAFPDVSAPMIGEPEDR